SLPRAHPMPLSGGGAIWKWFEHLEGAPETLETTEDGAPALVRAGKLHYLAGWPEPEAFARIIRDLARAAGLTPMDLPEGLRLRDTATHRVWINYGAEAITHEGRTIGGADVLWEAR
ncbi:MAG: beta-galactosidase, partial [Pseudomonadota bacterium]